MRFTFLTAMAAIVCSTATVSADQFGYCPPACPPTTTYNYCPPACAPHNSCAGMCDEITFSAAWLYWKLSGDELDYVIEKQAIGTTGSPSLTEYKQTVHNVRMDWDSGFRIGLGVKVPCYGWNADLVWTHYDTTKTKKTAITGALANTAANGFGLPSLLYFEGTVPGGTTPQTYAFTGHEKFNFEVIDLEFGKWCCCDCLSFKPHVGLRAADIEESFHINGDYGTGITENSIGSQPTFVVRNQVHVKNEFKGIGVRAGLDTALCLCDGWSIVGRAAAALVWGNNDLKQHYKEFGSDGTAIAGHTRDRSHHDRAFTDLAFGVRWATCACDCYPVVLELTWEHHYLFNQHRFWADTRWNSPDVPNNSVATTKGNSGWKKNGDIALQGLTLSASLDF